MILDVFIYFIFYLIGVVLGSFFTLAIYRIPLKQDITHTRSYCPKCNHRLEFFDLIPILSYLFLGGKCRYCHNKISKRYINIEISSGLVYLLFIISLGINFLKISIFDISIILYGTLMFSVLFILGGISKESKVFSIGVFIFGLIVQLIYIIYLCILKNNIYRYIIYIIALVLILILRYYINNYKWKEYINIMLIVLFSIVATNELVGLISLVSAIVLMIIKKIFKLKTINYVFYISFITVFGNIIINFII